MINRLLTVFAFVFLFSNVITAQEFNKVGTAAAQFLKIEAGARPMAMGGAYAAIADDPYALYWNVAGIAQIRKFESSFSTTDWIAGLSHSFAGMVIPMGGKGSIGFSVLTLNIGEFEQTTIEEPRGTGLFIDSYDVAIGISYANLMTDFVSVGITGKYIQQKLWDLSAESIALDVGFLLNTGYKGTKLGITLSNFGPDMKLGGRNLTRGFDKWTDNVADPILQTSLETTSWPLPTSYRVSMVIDIIGSESSMFSSNGNNQFIVTLDALHPNDNPEHYSIGTEYMFSEMISLRFGYKGRTDEQGIAAGGGVRVPVGGDNEITLDYAYADFGIFDFVQQFSLSFGF